MYIFQSKRLKEEEKRDKMRKNRLHLRRGKFHGPKSTMGKLTARV